MVNFEYVVPTQIVFGKDTQLRVAELVSAHGGTKVLVHFGGNQHGRQLYLLGRLNVRRI